MARFTKFKNAIPQKDGPETRRPLRNYRRIGTVNLSITSPRNVEDPQCFSRLVAPTIQGKQNLWN